MVKKKVFVTGGSGYLGAQICLYLANEGYSVSALCHSKIPSDQEWVSKMDKVLIGDVRDESFLQVVANYEYDFIVHLVSLDHRQSNNSPLIVSSVNIIPVWSLLDIFSKKGLKKFIYFSTAQVYGDLENEIITEKRKVSTLNPYGLTHQIGEVVCDYYNRNTTVDCVVVRLSNSYGAPVFEDNNCWWLVVNDLCRTAYTKKQIFLQSDGTPLRDFIHGWDVCRAVQTIIETEEKHTIYNLCSGSSFSILEIAEKVKNVFEQRYRINISIKKAESRNITKIMPSKLDNSLIQSIGFQPKWVLEAGINNLFDYLERETKLD